MAIRLRNGVLALRNGLAALVIAGVPVDPTDPTNPTDPGGEGPPAGTLSIVDFANDMTPYQRVGTSKPVRVQGQCDPSVTSVRVRAVIASTNVAHTAWTDIPASAGSFDGMLTVPQGDWCKLQANDGTNTVTTAKRFGVGIIGLLIGQSNMEERPKRPIKSPLGDPRCIEYNRQGALIRIGNINDRMPPNTTLDVPGYSSGLTIQSNRADGYAYTANLLAQGLNCIVCLVERAVGGSNMIDWIGLGSPANDKWKAAADAVTAVGSDCEFALWYQGESNANGTSTATMLGYLNTLQAKCHTLTGRNASNFHFGVISLGPGTFGSSEGQFGNMRAAHVQFANNTAGAFMAGSAHDSQTNDVVHIIAESHSRVAVRNVMSLLSRLGVGATGAGPRIVSASRVGSVVTLTVQHTGGSTLKDGAGGTGGALTGFEFKDSSGAALAYTSSIAGPTTLQFTVNGIPATVSYAMMNNPHNTDRADPKTAVVAASVPCDDRPILSSTYGCPLQPCAPINITGS